MPLFNLRKPTRVAEEIGLNCCLAPTGAGLRSRLHRPAHIVDAMVERALTARNGG